MFNWLFKKFQLEPPKPNCNDIEKKRFLTKELIDQAAGKVLRELIENNLKNNITTRTSNQLQPIIKPFIILGKTKPFNIKVPKPKVSLVLVPFSDYEIMKIIRLGWAVGEGTTQLPIEESGYTEKEIDETHYNNARILCDHYGMSKDEIFQLTGCFLKE